MVGDRVIEEVIRNRCKHILLDLPWFASVRNEINIWFICRWRYASKVFWLHMAEEYIQLDDISQHFLLISDHNLNNAGLLLTGSLQTYPGELSLKLHRFSLMKMNIPTIVFAIWNKMVYLEIGTGKKAICCCEMKWTLFIHWNILLLTYWEIHVRYPIVAKYIFITSYALLYSIVSDKGFTCQPL